MAVRWSGPTSLDAWMEYSIFPPAESEEQNVFAHLNPEAVIGNSVSLDTQNVEVAANIWKLP